MAATNSEEARELQLVERVELRIALAESDEKLQALLKTYLAPLLLKLGSEHLAVRNKVISLCQHINTRVKPKNVQLPVAALMQQFRTNSQPLIRHFDLVYAQQGLDRLPASDRQELFLSLVAGVSSNSTASAAHASSYFNILLHVLPDYRLPVKASKDDDGLRETLKLTDADAKYLSTWFGRLQLLRSQSQTSPGLSRDAQAFLTMQGKPDAWNPSALAGLSLTEAKISALKFISSGAFTDDERLLPALFAASDANSRISDIGDDLLKLCLAHGALEDEQLVKDIYQMYFGVSGPTPGLMETPPASPSLRIRLLAVLSKSRLSLHHPEKINAIVELDLLSDVTGASEGSSRDIQSVRLRSGVASFLTFVVRNASKEQLAVMSQDLLPKLMQVVEAARSTSEDRTLLGRIFEVLGLLANSSEHIAADTNLTFLHWLFQSLGEEPDRNVVVSIDEAISATLRPFENQQTGDEVQAELRRLLLDNMGQNTRNQRNVVFACLRFANRCLPFHNVTARYIDLLALVGTHADNHEVGEEAKKGLDPYWQHLMSRNDSPRSDKAALTFPSFEELVSFTLKPYSQGRIDLPLLKRAVPFCRHTLYARALENESQPLEFGIDWDRKLDLAVAEEPSTKLAIRKSLYQITANEKKLDAFLLLWKAMFDVMKLDETPARAQIIGFAVEISSIADQAVLSRLSESYQNLDTPILSNDLQVSRAASHLYGLLASHPQVGQKDLISSAQKMLDMIKGWNEAIGSKVNSTHGAILAVSYFISRDYQRSGVLTIDDHSQKLLRNDHDTYRNKFLKTLLPCLIDILLHSHQQTLINAALLGLGQLCLFRVINCKDLTTHVEQTKLLEVLLKYAKASNERAIQTLGYLSLVLHETGEEREDLQKLLSQIYDLHEIRQPETQFSVGEALSVAACGWGALVLRTRNDLPDHQPQGPPREETSSSVVDKVLESCSKTKPALKKAAVIWALCLLQHGSDLLVQDKLTRFQIAFKKCLTDRDELVQESAARGLGIVYERGDRSLKDDLVRDLVGSFSSNRVDMSGTVTEDTQLFDEGALPTNDGSVSTYKDIMSLASEVGDSSLVYRFMSLASTNAIWSSRAAFGRFGLSNVLSDSSVDGYLASNPKLYPKLFRYRFDPNSTVRKSMNDIWSALVKDTAATIDKNFSAIMEDLLASILAGRDWRSRQAACSAIADLVQSQKHEQVEPYLEQVWTVCFKVLDDIKESVQKSALELARVLSGILIRSLENAQGKSTNVEKMLRRVLPFLMSPQCLESRADAVRVQSISTLLKIIKRGKATSLRPFLPALVEKLLLLQGAGAEGMDYLYLNASKYKLKEQDIDDYRLKAVQHSPITEGLERCIDMLDEESVKAIISTIEDTIKSAVDMPTKVGCSRFVVSLCTRRSLLVRPYARNLLQAVQKRMLDRNATVSSSYAAAMGYLCRSASDDQILSVADFAKKLYFESEDERQQMVSGEIMHAIAKNATDRFSGLAASMLPFIFIGRQSESEEVRTVFKETWNDNVGGMRAVSLYLTEILTLVDAQLESRRWGLKHAAALALAEAIEAIAAAAHGQLAEAEATRLWPSLKIALVEKSWEGKEKILEAFAVFVAKAEALWVKDADAAKEVLKIALREAKRRNAEYQSHAMKSLAKISETLADEEHALSAKTLEEANAVFDSVAAVSSTSVEEQLTEESGEAMEVDGEGPERSRAGERRIRCIAAAIDALAAVLPAGLTLLDAASIAARYSRTLPFLLQASRDSSGPVNSAIFTCCRKILDLSHSRPESLVLSGKSTAATDALAGCEQLLFARRELILPESVRLRRAEAILALVQTSVQHPSPSLSTQESRLAELSRQVQTVVGLEKSTQVRAALLNAQSLLQ